MTFFPRWAAPPPFVHPGISIRGKKPLPHLFADKGTTPAPLSPRMPPHLACTGDQPPGPSQIHHANSLPISKTKPYVNRTGQNISSASGPLSLKYFEAPTPLLLDAQHELTRRVLAVPAQLFIHDGAWGLASSWEIASVFSIGCAFHKAKLSNREDAGELHRTVARTEVSLQAVRPSELHNSQSCPTGASVSYLASKLILR
mmetsp:Transcript_13380/g.27205  ORF Transcript_13380/g.27205 Transcript_13380/m.27205 type:complete len:201 (-) Transcript_13380:740-1342(-)